jgi:hypothetical protein
MVKEKIMISLEEGLRTEVEKAVAPFGGKISTLVETLLKQFLENTKLGESKLQKRTESHITQLEEMKKKLDNQIKLLKKEESSKKIHN